MVKSVSNKIAYIFFAVCAFVLFAGVTSAKAEVFKGENSLCGGSFVIDEFYKNADDVITENEDSFVSSLLSSSEELPGNIAFAKVDAFLNIRKGPSTDSEIIGYLPKDGFCYILSDPENNFVKIESGDVTGYASLDYLYIGSEAREKSDTLGAVRATVSNGLVNIRSSKYIDDDNIVGQIAKGQSLEVSKELVLSDDDEEREWVEVEYDGQTCYMVKKYVDVGRKLVYACSIDDVFGENGYKNVTALRAAIVTEAKKHMGLKYVWGGLSLSKGADCSGFCCAVYGKCGFDLLGIARSSASLAASSQGRKVSYEEAKPGDLVFYRLKKGRISHVAMYLGGGQIIHESSSSGGVVISDINCMKVAMIKNYLD